MAETQETISEECETRCCVVGDCPCEAEVDDGRCPFHIMISDRHRRPVWGWRLDFHITSSPDKMDCIDDRSLEECLQDVAAENWLRDNVHASLSDRIKALGAA